MTSTPASADPASRRARPFTQVVGVGRTPARHGGSVSPPVERTSTRLFERLDDLERAHASGKLSAFLGSNTPEYLEQAMSELEGPDAMTVVTATGMSALAITFLSVLKPGDHLLMPDNVFGPTRQIALDLLAGLGIGTDFYDPLVGPDIAAQFRDRTRLVLTESPGSNSFEVSDIPAIVAACRQRDIPVAMDNSWATPLYFRAIEHGVDFSVCAGTKYIVGHSDALIGSVSTTERHYGRLLSTARQLGNGCSPDDAFLALRGLRTLAVRLRQHHSAGVQIAKWLSTRSEVRQVLHPALPDSPGHACWARDFLGASGLFAIVLDELPRARIEAFLSALKLFKLGYSWGGFESLILPLHPDPHRTVLPFPTGTLIRLHVGLEDPDDLRDDLERAFAQLAVGA